MDNVRALSSIGERDFSELSKREFNLFQKLFHFFVVLQAFVVFPF